ncbi:putative ATP12, ATP synthase F1-assembly protein [Septoria linicola]|nr:putative ATP12, ATP synthase F1-assembly protein [Septoria linicola]
MEASLYRSSLRAASSFARPRPVQRFVCARCLLHTTSTNSATPVAHPTVPGPPPSAPEVSPTHPESRLARKRQQAALLKQGENIKPNPAKPALSLQKRFWKNVSVKEAQDGGLQIMLDTRPVRTATKDILTLPKHKRALAAAIALEWDQLVSAQQALKQHYIPLTSLTSRAIDIGIADKAGNTQIRDNIVKMAMRYLSTDTLLCWAPEHNRHDSATMEQRSTKNLRARQKAIAEPIIGFLTTHIFPGVEIVPVLSEDSIMPIPQPEMTTQVITGWVAGLTAFDLAALERAILATKSLTIAARLVVEWSADWKTVQNAPGEAKFGIEHAEEASSLEVLHQTEQWGEVEDTHDVEKEDLRRQLGSAILLVS